MDMEEAPLKYKLAQLISKVWRFQTLRLSNLVFNRWGDSIILNRKFGGEEIFLDVSRSNAQRLLYLEGEKFVKEKGLIDRIVKPNMKVVDVGANIGYYMILLSSRVGNEGEVVCFEPEPKNISELKTNLRRNKLGNVEFKKMAVGEENKVVKFTSELNGEVSSEGEIEVQMVSLDTEVQGVVDAIKIDVEGYEGAVLEGAGNIINTYHPNLIVEIHPWLSTEHNHEEIFRFLEECYSNVEYHEVRMPDIWSKIAYRYLGRNPIVKIHKRHKLLADCMDGRRESTFWALCYN